MKTLLIASFLSTIFAFGVLGCDEVDEAFDCAAFCNAYEDCVDSDTDIGECTRECQDIADESDEAADQADECENCLDGDQTCASQIFGCTADCALFVPAAT